MEEKPRLSRLTAILTQLQSKQILTAREIAEKHKVSIRTIYRDIRTLENSGIPIITEEGKGYSIMEGFHLPPILFSEDEANALITAEQIIRTNKDKSLFTQYQNAVEKVKAVLRYSQKGKTELLSERIHIRTNQKNETSSNLLITLQSALTNYKLIELHYTSLEKKKTKRNIEPFALLHTNENWILIAFCHLRNDFRAFRLDCMKKIIVSNILFEPHKITLQEYFEQAKKKWNSTN